MTSSSPYTIDNDTFTVDPSANLSNSTTFKIRVTTGVKDPSGNSMISQYETGTGFTTEDNVAPTAPIVSGTTPTTDTTPTWSWSAGGGGNGTYRYKLDSNDFNSGATQTTSTSYTPGSGISEGSHTLYVKEVDASGNWSLSGSRAIFIDSVAPIVSSVSSSDPNGKYKGGCVITIKVTFSETVIVTGSPRIELETGTTDRFANYTTGSGTNTLRFVYTVVSGDVFSDLDYKSTSSLSTNSGTIRDSAANNATLTLASPGASNSLGNNKAFVYNSKASSCGS